MLKIILVRHGATPGNLEKKYIGSTDEELSGWGIQDLLQKRDTLCYPAADKLYVSPLKRCRQTARLLYPVLEQVIIEDLRECDFGQFENKNYLQLQENPAYQLWVDSGGVMAFPEGEHPEDFRRRCVKAFLEVLKREEAGSGEGETLAFVVHGGTIMSVMAALCTEEKGYFDWQVLNGGGYVCTYTEGRLDLCCSIIS